MNMREFLMSMSSLQAMAQELSLVAVPHPSRTPNQTCVECAIRLGLVRECHSPVGGMSSLYLTASGHAFMQAMKVITNDTNLTRQVRDWDMNEV